METLSPTDIMSQLLKAMAKKHWQTDEGDALCFTIEALAQAINQTTEEARLKMGWLLQQGLAYKPLSYDQRFVSLNDAGLRLANNLP